ncbi:MAG: cupin domain-containing protein [Candidatus Omnitrophica bacterium]|nr:MAG: Cupin domain protein [Candidatus Hinthialibacteria bacterium OLB16]MBE7487224.1 cupin domain-containing protein [bacterium]MBK7493892.1 cupin domain-containing protein [Candidatus Omnitrophota bacterium]MCE7909382.1 cupin domain-containing protein [Candidatus Omnitrophica bacterium COP1]MBV6481716.1 hypothetical protein [bacterium]
MEDHGITWKKEVSTLADMVQYHTGSIVSRALISKKTGIVTLFAFDGGQSLSEHTSPFDAMVNILDGVAEITISGTSFKVSQGEAILMPAGEPHALSAPQPFKMMLVMIKSHTSKSDSHQCE